MSQTETGPRSFHNRILRVDLNQGEIRVEEPGVPYLRRTMGGWNTIADTLLKEVPAGADPLGPENKLIFAPGVLTGLPLSGASRNAIGAKSPLTGAFGASEVGGAFGRELKRAGFDAVIVEGVSPQPVYLWIQDGVAELRDASHLWGQPTKETLAAIEQETGESGSGRAGRVGCALIGPGGENLVSFACVMSGLKDAAGRTGMGAVMGSKKLKAVAVRGSQNLQAVDNDRIREIARDMARAVQAGEKAAWAHQHGTGGGNLRGGMLSGNLPTRNFRDGNFEGTAGISGENFIPDIGLPMEGCPACAVRCKNVVQTQSPYQIDPAYGGPEYESIGALGSCCGVGDFIAVSKATELCNAYSLDTIGAGVTIALAMECFEHGLLTLADTDGIDLTWGNGDAVIQMVEKIARREGFGEVLAGSVTEVAQRIGQGAEQFAMEVKGQAYPMHEPRLKRGLAIGYALSPTGADHCHALHDMGLGSADEEGFQPNSDLRRMGVLDPMPLESLGPEKVRATIYTTLGQVLNNCLNLCFFVPWTLDEKVEMVRAATGWDVTAFELMKVGERALTLARLFNVREGFGLDDDHLAERSSQPTTSGALSDAGIDPDQLRQAVHTYYGMMGWDEETGVPRAAKLHELDVSWAVGCLPG
jgi:aldehyde:ferredoxin oxidoreductase